MNPIQAYNRLAQSTVAILRVTRGQGRLVGTGFVVSKTPHILTCNHVVQPYDPNNAAVRYGVVKRRLAPGEVLDLRQAQISWIGANNVRVNPDLDLAILTVDVRRSDTRDTAKAIGLLPPVPLELNFNERNIGDKVAWLGMAVLGDLMATPRFFEGVIVSSYVNDSRYTYTALDNTRQTHRAIGLQLIEINQLFVPGCSGGPVLSLSDGKVIAYVHGYGSWAVGVTPGSMNIPNVQLTAQTRVFRGTMRMNAPVVAALSRAIDVRSIEEFLRAERILAERLSLARRLTNYVGKLVNFGRGSHS